MAKGRLRNVYTTYQFPGESPGTPVRKKFPVRKTKNGYEANIIGQWTKLQEKDGKFYLTIRVSGTTLGNLLP